MNSNSNNENARLDQALRAHAAWRGEPSPDCRARCRAAAHGALDLLKMQQHRARVGSPPGSLQDYLNALARAAGVTLDATFTALRSESGPASVTALVQIAQHLGLLRDEVVLRVRWGVSQAAGFTSGFGAPVRCRGARITDTPSDETMLAEHEREYQESQRAALRKALRAVDEVYGPVH